MTVLRPTIAVGLSTCFCNATSSGDQMPKIVVRNKCRLPFTSRRFSVHGGLDTHEQWV